MPKTNMPTPPFQSPWFAPDGQTISVAWQKWLVAVTSTQSGQNGMIDAISPTSVTQDNLPAVLTAEDAGDLYYISDFGHVLEWNGSAWQWGPGELGSGYVADFLYAPTTPGWQPCNGQQVNMLNGNGSVTAIVLPTFAAGSLSGTAAYFRI